MIGNDYSPYVLIRLGITYKFLSILQEIRSSWDPEHLSVISSTGIKSSSANVGLRSCYVKNLGTLAQVCDISLPLEG